MHIAQNIRLIRLSAGLEQQEFADKMGATIDQVRNWEGKRSKPNDLFKQKIADFACISIADLDYNILKTEDLFQNAVVSNDGLEGLQLGSFNDRDIALQAIFNLTQNQRMLIENNSKLLGQQDRLIGNQEKLTDNNTALTQTIIATVNAPKESSVDVDAKISDVLAVIGVVGTNRGWWHSPQEAFAELSRLFHGTKESVSTAGIQTG